MNLTLFRGLSTDKSTPGRLYINEVYECVTLEDVVRKEKIYGETAIPAGKYNVIIDYSPQFNKELPHILDVPGFSGIRIHSGNKAEETKGCILVGTLADKDWIGYSKLAFTSLFSKIKFALDNNEQVTIEIK